MTFLEYSLNKNMKYSFSYSYNTSISFYLYRRFSYPGKHVYVIAFIIIFIFDFFWNEFFLSIGTIFGSCVILWLLLYLWNVDYPAKILSSFLFLLSGGLLSVWIVFIVFKGLVDLLLFIRLSSPYFVIIVLLSLRTDYLHDYSYLNPLFFRFLGF